MADAFKNGRQRPDRKPYAPHAPWNKAENRPMTPLEHATARGLVGCWISTGRPNTAASRRVAAGAAIQADHDITIQPHPWDPVDGQCSGCRLPRKHRIHHTDIQPTELDARVMGEREEENA